jgi:Ca2+-binding RTX toxin-like protein
VGLPAVILATLAVAPHAMAANVRVGLFQEYDRFDRPSTLAELYYDARGGETNRPVIKFVGTVAVVVRETGNATLTAGPGCHRVLPTVMPTVVCNTHLLLNLPAPPPLARVVAALYDGNDAMSGSGFPDTVYLKVDGGSGDDRLTGGAGESNLAGGDGSDYLVGGTGHGTYLGGPGADRIVTTTDADVYGGPGDDLLQTSGPATLLGQDGNDRLESTAPCCLLMLGGPGADDFFGGAAKDDIVRYEDTVGLGAVPRPSVTVTIDDVANDGAPGEGDNVHRGVEVIQGSSLIPNSLTGDAADNYLAGGGMDDVLLGGAGADYLQGFTGADRLVGGTGADKLYGYFGDDSIDAKDGETDRGIFCGDGADTVLADPADPFSNEIGQLVTAAAAGCESVSF